ncbi:ABC transporter ATP-binding protein [Chelativorans sp. AA-79]|uniref:ABC transporter ATP-binding protein n=1 Tax=Chelativorans sp. AA-79 TaxID=3028735 RepID=UPI0023F8CDC9|nr:ABC transporter ATP-binding protein [Chelativorans sp. AA-79]WEX11748.1 ABC transporter ATP-binding protein [Chelativorans sp. AA-79]
MRTTVASIFGRFPSKIEPDAIIAVIRRVLAENGRDFIPQYRLAILCMLILAPTAYFNVWALKYITDDVFVERDWNAAWMIAGAIVVVFAIRGVASYGQAVLLAQVGNNIVARYQRRMFDHLMRLDVGFFTGTRSGQLASRIAQNVTGIRDLLNLTLAALARDVVQLVTLVVAMVTMDPVLSLFVLIIVPPLLYAIGYVTRRVRSVSREAVEINSRLLGAMQESVQGISIIKAFTMESVLADKMARLIKNAEARSNKIARLSERLGPITELLTGFAIAAVVVYAGWRIARNGEPPGAVVAFLGALFLSYEPARKLVRAPVNIERALVNARMIYEILDLEPAQPDAPGAEPLKLSTGNVRFEKVRFSYSEHMPVLHGVSFDAAAGRTTAIVGPSGAGKSTLFALLQRFYDLDGGAILVDGQDISRVTKRSLRSSIAYVSQHPYLFEGTIRDNVRYGRPDAADAEVEEAARLANAEEFILQQENGYETLVGENGATLSGGQRQRLSIARAIVRNAPILLLDEATSALDNESEAKVQQALERVMAKRTTLVIAHRLSTVVNADHIVVLEEGRLVEQGTHRMLVKKPHGIYARFYRMQTEGAENLLEGATVDVKGTPMSEAEEGR